MGIFENIESAADRRNQVYEGPGSYLMMIENVKQGKTRKGVGNVIIEKRVVACLDAKDFTEFEGKTFQHHKVGDLVSDYLEIGQDYFLPNFKSFIKCALDDKQMEVSEELCDSVLDDGKGNPSMLKGIIVRMANRQASSKKGVVITIRNYEGRIKYSSLEKYMEASDIEKWVPDYEEGLKEDR